MNNDAKAIVMQSGYMQSVFGSLDHVIEDFLLYTDGVKYDTLVGIGLSGSLIVPRIADALDKNWLIVRKDDNSHSYYRAEGVLGKRWIFVDDFIHTGATAIYVLDQIRQECKIRKFRSYCVGAYSYQPCSYLKNQEFRNCLKDNDKVRKRKAEKIVNDAIGKDK